MAYGDVGGPVTELVITCRTKSSGTVDIVKGQAVKLVGGYVVDNDTDDEDPVFGQAQADSTENDALVPVKVRGVCIVEYVGSAPTVDGAAGIVASATDGTVKAPASGNGHGINLKVDTNASEVHVLL
ncbi:MAG: hypothetical protein KAJ01_10765 [Candidatus Hydrogenedentes bacterium]|nr:hypothetical protein [Candidatus Hydrogenedentota bacterium]